jgi:hypothetical protein
MNSRLHAFSFRYQAALLLCLSSALVVPVVVPLVATASTRARSSSPDVVLSMRSDGGFAPMFTDFRTPPRHLITPSRVHYRPADMTTDSNSLVSKVVSDQMSKPDLAKVDALATAAGLNQKVDWGLPNTADVPNLTITYRGRAQSIPSYGVGEESLTKKQQSARRRVASLLEFLDKRRGGKEVKPAALVAAALEAQDVPQSGKKALRSSGSLANPAIRVQDWPSSAPSLSKIGDCSVITDPTTVVTLTTAPDTVRFRSDNKVWQVFARIKLPGDKSCSI